MKKKLLNFIMTVWARLTFRGTPSPECWVFSSVHNRAFNYNSRYLFCYVKEHCPGIHPYYVTEDPAVYRELAGRYGEEFLIDTSTLAGIRKVLSCQVWFTSTAPPLYGVGFWKKYRIYNLWHGIPLKTIGMEQKNLSPVTRAYYRYFFADNYTGVLTTSSRLVPLMSRSFLVEPERDSPGATAFLKKRMPKRFCGKFFRTGYRKKIGKRVGERMLPKRRLRRSPTLTRRFYTRPPSGITGKHGSFPSRSLTAAMEENGWKRFSRNTGCFCASVCTCMTGQPMDGWRKWIIQAAESVSSMRTGWRT